MSDKARFWLLITLLLLTIALLVAGNTTLNHNVLLHS